MNFKLVLRTYSQLRQLTDDETALLETLRGMSDAERELLAETLGPPVKGKVGKTAKTTRTFEKCEVCNYSRRAAVHKDSALDDYHEFVSAQARGSGATEQKKSKRASELAGKIAGTARGTEMVFCAYELNGKVCKGLEDDAIHDKSMGYGGYHPFVSSSSVHPAVGQSFTNGDEVSSETGLEDVSAVAGG